MLYTGKGDKGTTKLFNCPQGKRISKAEFVFEVLGVLDELNSSLGYAKVLSKKSNTTLLFETHRVPYHEIIETFQQNLFCIQAGLGGSNMHATREHISYLEKVIYEVETLLPPVKSFIIPGSGATGAFLDVTRTVTRRAERQLLLLQSKKDQVVNQEDLTFMNRLTSALYALARFANYQEGHSEVKPNYK